MSSPGPSEAAAESPGGRPPGNIILIGMPGAGKSTVGVLLAKRLAKGFMDTDLLIQTSEGRTLQDIVDHEGHLALRAIEARELSRLDAHNQVIATGGSAVYSPEAMRALRAKGIIVYLRATLPTLAERVTNLDNRGIAKAAGQSFEDVFSERTPLYEHHAGITVDCDGHSPEAVVEIICAELQSRPPGPGNH